jgi:hypothetical protein
MFQFCSSKPFRPIIGPPVGRQLLRRRLAGISNAPENPGKSLTSGASLGS